MQDYSDQLKEVHLRVKDSQAQFERLQAQVDLQNQGLRQACSALNRHKSLKSQRLQGLLQTEPCQETSWTSLASEFEDTIHRDLIFQAFATRAKGPFHYFLGSLASRWYRLSDDPGWVAPQVGANLQSDLQAIHQFSRSFAENPKDPKPPTALFCSPAAESWLSRYVAKLRQDEADAHRNVQLRET